MSRVHLKMPVQYEKYATAFLALGARTAPSEPTFFHEVVEPYNEPERRYHCAQHPRDLLAVFDQHWWSAQFPHACVLSLVYHDVIYQAHSTPGSSDNELASMQLFQKHARECHMPAKMMAIVAALIMGTDHKPTSLVPGNARVLADQKLIIDIDLSILGSNEEKFADFERLIRQEYSHYSARVYAQGRAHVLQTFLDRSTIYYGEAFIARYERPARRNMKDAIQKLNTLERMCP
jgi:predicted metal-dependent HD superfamily phosphohydrolase